MKRIMLILTACLLGVGIYGCEKKATPQAKKKIEVTIVRAEQREITRKTEFLATVRPNRTVDIVTRVSGFLNQQNFVEGKFVTKGALLYNIEDVNYKAEVEIKKGNLKKAGAQYENAKTELARNEKLIKQDAVSKTRYDDTFYRVQELQGEMITAQGSLSVAETNFSYCKIYAPFTGMIGFTKFNEGNYVTPSSGTLCTLNEIDTVRVGFNLNEDDLLNARLMATKDSSTAEPIRVMNENFIFELIFQPSGILYEHKGIAAFMDNQVSDRSGTYYIECLFHNPKIILFPGMYVKIRIRDRKPLRTLVIPRCAITEVQAGKQVIVVNDQNITDLRIVKTGVEDGHFVEVLDGIREGEKVVVEGMIRASRRGLEVQSMLSSTETQTKPDSAKN